MNARNGLASIPLLAIPWLVAQPLALLAHGLDTDLFGWTMPSGASILIRAGDIVVLLALVALGFEWLKSARGTGSRLIDHVGSVVVLVVAVLEWLFVGRFAHMAIGMLVAAALLDVIGGFAMPLAAARPWLNRDNDPPLH